MRVKRLGTPYSSASWRDRQARRAAFALVGAGLAAALLAGELRAQYRNDSAALYAALAAHVAEASGSGRLLLIEDPRLWGILPRRIVESIVARLEARGIAAADCRLGCLEEPGDIHLGFGPIEFLADHSAWVTVHSFGLVEVGGPRRLWLDRTAYRVEYRDGEWVVVESRSDWTI